MFPSDKFNSKIYRSKNPDLRVYNRHADLLNHYNAFGRHEGRVCTEIDGRDSFLRLLAGRNSLLEIGVFDRPSLEFLRQDGLRVDYADWLSKEDLMLRAELTEGRDQSNVPDIAYVLSNGSYDQIKLKYDAVVSHHCVEHQPDLITHFLNIKSILSDDGWYFFSIPDKRFCFDHFIPESTIVDVLDAYYLERKAPSFKSVLEHRCFTSHGFYDGIDPYKCRDPAINEACRRALDEFKASSYVDVHCWIFTSFSFAEIFTQTVELGLLPKCRDFKVYPGRGEFYVAIAF
jgi:hypothetical protein